MKNNKRTWTILIVLGGVLVALVALYFIVCGIYSSVLSENYFNILNKSQWVFSLLVVLAAIYCIFFVKYLYTRKLYFETRENEEVVNKSLAAGYDSISIIDIESREVSVYKRKGEIQKIESTYFTSNNYDEIRQNFADKYVFGDDRDIFLMKTSIDYIMRALEKKWSMRVNYRFKNGDIVQYYGTRFLKENIGKSDKIIYATRNMDMDIQDEVLKSLKMNSALKEAEVYKHAIFSNARNCFECDMDDDIVFGDYYDVINGELVPTKSFKSLPHPLKPSMINDYIADNYLLSDYADFKNKTSKEYLAKCFDEGTLNPDLDFEARGKDGGVVYNHIEFFLSRDLTTNHLKAVAVITDNTSKREDEILVQKKNYTEAHAKAKSEFFSLMSHDLMTPMRSILNLTNELKEKLSNNTDVIDKIDHLEVTSKHLESIIDNITNLNKTESDRIESISVSFDFDNLMEDVLEMTRNEIEEKSINLAINSDEVNNKSLYGDSLHLKQILTTLVKNSSKYVPERGSITIDCVEIQSGEKSMFKFKVTDNGSGMVPELVNTVFDEYKSETATYNTDYSTTGLSLILVKKYVDALEGSITCESKVNEGTTFSIIIPLEIDNPEERKIKDDVMALSGIRILFAEDNDITLKATREMLEDSGCIVTTCKNGKEAYDIFNLSDPLSFDCILMDVQMPVMDGVAATELIRSLSRADAVTTPIIGLTSDNSSELLNETIEAGMDARLFKPVEKGQLVKVLLTCMHARSLNLVTQLESTMSLVNRDALTGVKNAQAYKEEIESLNTKIKRGEKLEFAIVYCDVNNLKKTNDTIGHEMGDELIKNACKYMCDIFKHSPVYRIGGDEFVIILKGSDYLKRDSLIKQCAKTNKEHVNCTFAYGMSAYLPMNDSNCQSIIRRADSEMYECKQIQKNSKK